MQLRPGILFGFAIFLASVSAFAQTPTLSAVNDRAVLRNEGRVIIDVLKNDSAMDRKPFYLKKAGKPKFGTVRIASDPTNESHQQVIVYTAGPAFAGIDTFQYTVTNLAGATASATVTVFGPRHALAGSFGTNILDPAGKPVGYLELDASSTGAFSGNIRIGTDEYSLKGNLTRKGRYTGFAWGEDDGRLPVSFLVTQEKESTLFAGRFGKDEEWTANHEIGAVTEEELSDLEGRYTVELPPPTNSTVDDSTDEDRSDRRDIPQGSGWMIVEVNDHGEASLKGKTGDGRSFSVKAYVGVEEGELVLPFYEAWDDASVLGGTLRMGGTIEGDLTWSRGETDEERYPDGFDLRVAARGARYVEPEGGRRALKTESSDAGRATLTINGEGLEEFTRELRFSEGDDVTDLDPNGDPIDLKINRENGTFTGKFRDPDDRETRVKFSGVLLQSEGRAVGLFEAKNKTGLIELKVSAETEEETTDPIEDIPNPIAPPTDTDPDLGNGFFFENSF